MAKESGESNLKVALTAGSSPGVDQFKDIITHFKQILGFIIGLIFGVLKVKGFFGIVLGLGIIILLSILYAQKYLEIDEDEVESSTIVTEGFQFGLMSFFVRTISWYFSDPKVDLDTCLHICVIGT
jgi:hypothetical protein